MSFVFSHRTVNMVYMRVCRNCPISLCGAKYLVTLANHLAGAHRLEHIQRRQYLQEPKLQPKVKVVIYESEADNCRKNLYRNPLQTQEMVYCKLSRSQRNEASLKAKAKRPTTKNKTKCKKQRKSTSCLRACLHEGEGPQVGEVTCLGGVKKITLLYMQSYNPAIPGHTFSRLLNHGR